MHAHTHGESHSTRPTSKSVPTWVSISHSDLESVIMKMYKEDGLTASQIGIILRDEHGIPLVKPILGKTIIDVLREGGVKQDMPEDLDRLVKKALGLQEKGQNRQELEVCSGYSSGAVDLRLLNESTQEAR
jgi:small subunit ribosomal protein S15